MTTMREEVEIRFRSSSNNNIGPDEDDDSLAEGEIAFLSPSTAHLEDDSSSSILDQKKALFRQAYQALAPGPLFRFVVYLYGERKLMVFFLLHFVATMVTWFHFGLVKWDEQKNSVPEGADFYWAKRLIPSVEFGSMHAILLQMALIPLTMSRLSIASLTDSIVDRFVPLNRMLRIHIHLGYVMVLVVFFSTVLFFIFFGTLCVNGDESFCDKMTSEIMCTGYGILSCLLIIAGTSYFRHNIPYEVFYAIHHLVFAMYAITIAHTFDDVQRNNERNRSQTFQWFSTTILFYFCDRAAMHLNHRYKTRLHSAKTVEGKDGSRMLLIKIRRPALFQFKPGQYAFIKVASIDRHWHPFSIASCPSSDFLEFYIETFGPNTWTGKLWDRLEDMEIEVMGPYGTSLTGNANQNSHGLAIGAGTGIVPILSMFKQHVRQILRLSPRAHLQLLEDNRQKRVAYELATERRKGSLAGQCIKGCSEGKHNKQHTRADKLRQSIRDSVKLLPVNGNIAPLSNAEMNKAAFHATKSIYGVIYTALLTTLGLALGALTVSWNTLPMGVYPNMVPFLQVMTLVFQSSFGFVATFLWDKNSLLAYVDLGSLVAALLSDFYWYSVYEDHGTLRGVDLAAFAFLTGYMVFRLWTKTVGPRHNSWKHAPGDESGASSIECLKVIWVSRSASLIAEILPDIEEIWQEILQTWDFEDAIKVCQFSVYCTDKDEGTIAALIDEVSHMALYKHNCIHFGRPDFADLIESHTIELTEQNRSSNTLLAFCGSPALAKFLHSCKVNNDMVAAISGYKQHQMEFVSENYGGPNRRRKSDIDEEDVKGAIDGRGKPFHEMDQMEELSTNTDKSDEISSDMEFSHVQMHSTAAH